MNAKSFEYVSNIFEATRFDIDDRYFKKRCNLLRQNVLNKSQYSSAHDDSAFGRHYDGENRQLT